MYGKEGTLHPTTSGGLCHHCRAKHQPRELSNNRYGFIFQAYNLIPVLTAEENVEYIMLLQGVGSDERRRRSREILKRVGDRGERVPELAKEYNVNPKTIYNLLKNRSNHHQMSLELAKLKRENEALVKIIGQMVADDKLGKKKK